MSNLGQMRREVADNLGLTLDSGRIEAQVNGAIIKAIRQLRHRPFPWNVAELSITPLVLGQGVYAKGGTTAKLATPLNGAAETSVVVSTPIPAFTPTAGTIFITLDSGTVLGVAYSSYVRNAYTIASTDFTGTGVVSVGATVTTDGNTLSTALTGAAETAVVLNNAIPVTTDPVGTIYITLDSGALLAQAYTSWAGSTYTIAATDFTGDEAASGNAVQRYPNALLPADFLYLWQQQLWCEDTAAASYDAWPMTPVSVGEYERLKIAGASDVLLSNSTDRGEPESFTFVADRLQIYPPPDATTYRLFGQYLRDLGEPQKSLAAGAWSFDDDAFTNAWFRPDAGYDPVVLQATSILALGWLKNTEAAQQWNALATKETGGRIIEEERAKSKRIIRGYF